jgi:hypothetical protein
VHTDDKQQYNDRALLAFLSIALRPDLEADFAPYLAAGDTRLLTPKARRALEALGPDVVARVMGGGVYRKPRRRRRPRRGRDRVGGSFRCGGTGILIDQARAEMDRKVRELEARERREAGDADRGED